MLDFMKNYEKQTYALMRIMAGRPIFLDMWPLLWMATEDGPKSAS